MPRTNPGYWAWRDGGYFWNAGYWAPEVGFYGGIDYGFGYTGDGYHGGRWDHDHFFHNRAVNNFGGTHITNVYSEPVSNVEATRVSFNGGRGGTSARPAAVPHVPPLAVHPAAVPHPAPAPHPAAPAAPSAPHPEGGDEHRDHP